MFLHRELYHSADDKEALKEELRREDLAAEERLGGRGREVEYA